ncbi:MAG: hypothetical protein CM1200mP2_49620 [Planctomycetaceae bacterium]|nr:MAG: hypothetical protein CM1200mP2_49620 [Planctomycetaceae bacterium]
MSVLLQTVKEKLAGGAIKDGRNRPSGGHQQTVADNHQVALCRNTTLGSGTAVRLRHFDATGLVVEPKELAGIGFLGTDKDALGLPDPRRPVNDAVGDDNTAPGRPSEMT